MKSANTVSVITSSILLRRPQVAAELTFKMSLWGVAGRLPKPINNIKWLFTPFMQPTPALPTNKRPKEDQRGQRILSSAPKTSLVPAAFSLCPDAHDVLPLLQDQLRMRGHQDLQLLLGRGPQNW